VHFLGGEWSASRPGRFTPRGMSHCYLFDRKLGGPQSQYVRCGEETILTLPELQLRTLGCPACNQSLYPLSYRDSSFVNMIINYFTFIFRSHFERNRYMRKLYYYCPQWWFIPNAGQASSIARVEETEAACISETSVKLTTRRVRI
jgi:hypothetical protein